MKMPMKSLIAPATITLLFGLTTLPAWAFHCPLLIKECNALVDKLAAKSNVDQSALAKAKQGCADAMALHKAGKHKASVMKAGEAITAAGAAVQ